MRVFLNRLLICSMIIAFAFGVSSAAANDRAGIVAAAASLQSMLAEVLPWFNGARDTELEGVFGASGNLARQIETGAPFDLFLSADEQWARYAEERKLLEGSPLPFAVMPLVLWHSGEASPSLDLLGDRTKSVAIANPEMAPFGKRARTYLSEKGLLEDLEADERLFIGGDVLKTGLAAMSGAADLAILPLSTAASLGEGAWTLLDAEPQTLFGGLVSGRASRSAVEFWEFIRSPEALPFLEKYGFMAP